MAVLRLHDALEIRWRAIVPTAIYNPEAGLEKAWALPENTWWGAPLTEGQDEIEVDGENRPARVFANVVVAWMPDGPRVIAPDTL